MIDIELRKNNIKSSKEYGKYFAHVVRRDDVGIEELAQKIQRNCSMKASDVLAVLEEMQEVIKEELASGNSVTLKGIGKLQLGVQSTGAESPKTFSTRNIKRVICKFRPQGSRMHTRNGKLHFNLCEDVKVKIKAGR